MGTGAEDGPADRVVRELYHAVLEGWDSRDAEAMAAPFAEEGEVIGFDGSCHRGRAGIVAGMSGIFAAHATPTYVAKVRSVRLVAPATALLQAVAGMVPPGESDLKPELNTRQTVLAVRTGGRWRIVLLQNTPARFHGRPELVESLTEELRELIRPTFDQ